MQYKSNWRNKTDPILAERAYLVDTFYTRAMPLCLYPYTEFAMNKYKVSKFYDGAQYTIEISVFKLRRHEMIALVV